MKIIISEKQYRALKSKFLNENEELNQYGLTDSEMREVEKVAEEETNDSIERLKNNIKELEDEVKFYSNYDFSNIDDEKVKEHIIKNWIEPKKKELVKLKKSLDEFNFEDWKQRVMQWHLYSAGGVGYSFRYERYKNEALNRNLTKEDIIDLFVTALEGGSNYWYYMDLPDNIKSYGQYISEAVGEYILQGGKIYFYDDELRSEVMYNLRKGEYKIEGDIIDQKRFDEDIEETYLGYVDMDKILDAISLIKKEYPNIWENILLEQSDAGDADVFLQLSVMGEVVFG
jgi:hypothetical protein